MNHLHKAQALHLRVGAMAFAAGLATYFISTVLHPAKEPAGESARAFLEYAASHGWAGTHVSQFLGLLLATFGFVGLAERLKADTVPSAVLGRLGLVAATVTLALAAVLQAVDGVALKFVVNQWAAAPEAQSNAAFRIAEAVRWIEVGTNSYMRLVLGVTLVLFGLALAFSALLPHWLGWGGIAAGVSEIAQAIYVGQHGFDPLAMALLMHGATLVYLAWFCAAAWVMWRRGEALARQPSPAAGLTFSLAEL